VLFLKGELSLRRQLTFLTLFILVFSFPFLTSADVTVGNQIITLGENLTDVQKKNILAEMSPVTDAQIITVSNKEEHKYLGEYIPSGQIGTKALSSSIITITEANSGLNVKTNNIKWVTDDMYTNALITAGVKDASIYITAPFPVSGTAALTGLLKAYELSSDKAIPEDVKQIANEEMVRTAELGDAIGSDKAAALMALIKEKLSENSPQTEAELRMIIEGAANELGITLTEENINSLISFFNKMKELNINWNQVSEQLNMAKDKLSTFLESDEGQNFLTKLKEFITTLIDAIKALFN
jgi:uncharacterized protein YpuA (DUF1002 family)